MGAPRLGAARGRSGPLGAWGYGLRGIRKAGAGGGEAAAQPTTELQSRSSSILALVSVWTVVQAAGHR